MKRLKKKHEEKKESELNVMQWDEKEDT